MAPPEQTLLWEVFSRIGGSYVEVEGIPELRWPGYLSEITLAEIDGGLQLEAMVGSGFLCKTFLDPAKAALAVRTFTEQK